MAKCFDSPNGKHKFVTDWEYDQSGRTINCEHCGEAAPANIVSEEVQAIRDLLEATNNFRSWFPHSSMTEQEYHNLEVARIKAQNIRGSMS